MKLRSLLLISLCMLPGLAFAEEPAAQVAACARLERSVDPLEAVRAWRGLPAAEQRTRLVEVLRRDVTLASRGAQQLLSAHDAREVRVLWGPGVICAKANVR